jgi:hypothetical protein
VQVVIAAPTFNITVADVTVSEAAGKAVFTLTRTDSSGPSTVTWSTQAGTAQAVADFTAASGTATFAAGSLTALVTVSVINDNLAGEGNETFTLKLGTANAGTITDNDASATIQDDDGVATVGFARTAFDPAALTGMELWLDATQQRHSDGHHYLYRQ